MSHKAKASSVNTNWLPTKSTKVTSDFEWKFLPGNSRRVTVSIFDLTRLMGHLIVKDSREDRQVYADRFKKGMMRLEAKQRLSRRKKTSKARTSNPSHKSIQAR